jgi:hypothetical protein
MLLAAKRRGRTDGRCFAFPKARRGKAWRRPISEARSFSHWIAWLQITSFAVTAEAKRMVRAVLSDECMIRINV